MSKVKQAVEKQITKEGLPREGSTSRSLSLNEVKEPSIGTECPQMQ